ncbi:T9SS type B sorting domain-containing protein [Taibaiella lutea]|uniref:T9SS type B sorting domain-containing protein n=1 Tax=Taibaiella lutea TaxID=2608001 RepID=A0A5M6CPG3_9BACT|nr:gliding motility-associated C-terminal domain-containing protein [Taibaiella lutea]KAA5536906.1 T9SS type B sorting domain-containing protein [Taibaiella lutea]
MNRISIFFAAFAGLCLNNGAFAQAPGGVALGLTAWYHAEAGTTVSPANVLTTWANQATNPNLTNLTPDGGATTLVNNNPVPFNFHSYLQHAAGCMRLANSVTNTDVVTTTQGSMMGAGTAPDQLICLTGNSTSGQFGNNRANTGTRGNRTEFGSGTTNGGANFAAGTVLNTGNANIFGLRAMVGAAPAHQNTYNGIKATGVAATRPAGSYRFAIGSFTGYFYGTNKSAEAVCHNRQLTSDEFSRVESYFAIKYGISLGTPAVPVDYLSSASAIVWPGDAAYQNNITGICRDDASGLIQKQSRAVTAKSKVFIFNDNTGGIFPAMNADNTTTFAADQSFVMFGDNNADTLLNVCAMNGRAVRMDRHWKMVKTGTVGDVTIAFTATELPADITTLLVSTNNTFPEAATTAIPLQTSGTYKYAVMPSDNTFFTFSATPLDVSVDVVNLTCQAANGGSMTANVTGGLAPISYQWNTTPPQTTATATNVPAGNYTVTVTQAAGCAYTQTATMANEIIDLMATLTATNARCNGDNNGSITVVNTNGTPAFSYSLNNQTNWVTTNQFQNLSAGLYRVYLKDINGCTGDDTISINEPDRLSLQFKNLIDDYCELGSNPNGNVEILLTGGTIPYNVTLNGSNIGPSLKLTNLKEDHYTYDVTDANGCKINDSFSIEHVPCCFAFVPNAFTPNMDGRNDIFKMETTGRILLNKMIVYNRYGQIVWGSFNQGEGWDGTQNGKPVDAGTYFYYIKYTCASFNGPKETELKGDITVVR